MATEEAKTPEITAIPRRVRYSRGYLPHFDSEVITQFVTFRLAGSLPTSVVRGLRRNLDCGRISEIEYYREIDKYLDMSEGVDFLRDVRIAETVEQTLLKFDGIKYDLHSWVIMPNHGHILLSPLPEYSLAAIMHSIKSFTSNFANKVLGRKGRFWSPEYFDRFIRDRAHYAKTVKYIENNPVKAGLCSTPGDWRWSSAWKPNDI
jgi:REP element-mobilizing transposase RayT